MSKFNNQYRTQSHRWQFWDYSAPAAYYLTVVTKNRNPIFGEISQNQMRLNDAGKFLLQQLMSIGENKPEIKLDTFVIMPDHFHCIIFIVDNEFDYPVDIQNDKHNFYEVNGVDTIHETAGSTTPIKINHPLSIVSTP